jgi:FkbM family methyltransferase
MIKALSALEYIYYRVVITLSIKYLDIEKAGSDERGTDYVKLRNGYIFFGPPSVTRDRKYYRLLPAKIRKGLPFSSYAIALDIIIRYKRGGLKLGGPAKESFYKIKQGDHVAEMGAFRGYFCMYMAQQVGPRGRVLAIEPLESNIFYLKKNIEANGLANVSIIQKGVWKEKDVLTFKRNDDDYQSSSIDLSYKDAETYQMNVDSLDNILEQEELDRMDFMVIQLNGAELEALEGLTKILPNHVAIAARYKKDGHIASTLIRDHLQAKNYRVRIRNRDYIFGTK